MYFIGFRTELVVLISSVQIYTTPNIMPGFRVFWRNVDTVPVLHQQGLVLNIWAMSLGI